MSWWFFWLLSIFFVVRWSALWWRTRRARLHFAWLAPVGAVAGVVIGLGSVERSMDRGSCFDGACRGDVAGFTASLDANAGLGGVILMNSLLGLLTAAALAVTTLVVETVLMVRRHESAARGSGGGDLSSGGDGTGGAVRPFFMLPVAAIVRRLIR